MSTATVDFYRFQFKVRSPNAFDTAYWPPIHSVPDPARVNRVDVLFSRKSLEIRLNSWLTKYRKGSMIIRIYKQRGDAREYRLEIVEDVRQALLPSADWIHIDSAASVDTAIKTLESYLNLETSR